MKIKNKYALFFFTTLLFVIILLVSMLFYKKNPQIFDAYKNRKTNIFPSQNIVSPSVIPLSPTPTLTEYSIFLENIPQNKTQGDTISFTWKIDGPKNTIKTTTVYYGTTSTPGKLGKDILPLQTKYSEYLKEFINGVYEIPLVFVGNNVVDKPGTYYARAYAVIDDKNYWSEEKTFSVNPLMYEIKIINFSDKVKLNQNSVFTWQIAGPPTTINYTAIVGAKESKSGPLDETTDLSKTPYRELTKEFISGSFQIPLQFIGNAVLPEYGTFYIRALAVINGKNIWSDEYQVLVE